MSGASPPLLWLTEAQVAALVEVNDALEALRVGLAEEADGAAKAIDKALGTFPGGALHALGSMMPRRGYGGYKTWAHTTGGATAIFSLFDLANGRLLSVLEAATLGQIRTSAVSGLGADLLSSPDADEVALVGTGAQALTQIAAIAAVRPLKRLRVFSRTPDKRAAFVGKARAAFGFEVADCGTLEEAVAGAPIVTLITRTVEPFLEADMLAPGALIIAAGAILPANAECKPDVLARSGRFVVDSIGNAQSSSRELREHFGTDPGAWSQVRTLGTVIRDGADAPDDTRFTFFKPTGMGLSDLSVAIMAYERARDADIGLAIDQPVRAAPRWRAAGA
ncbi:ornithine cyclodeaminase family protein [Sphingomonas profundi]|uniref:ornithine cyclodeaminase family protein n=1 Tax=Alterirhizorhabdus profundi TaxID=2681549 RepID=UPI0018D06A39|nr:ornithine cyclodeaminase family protein [Sphingomonas profundi]